MFGAKPVDGNLLGKSTGVGVGVMLRVQITWFEGTIETFRIVSSSKLESPSISVREKP